MEPYPQSFYLNLASAYSLALTLSKPFASANFVTHPVLFQETTTHSSKTIKSIEYHRNSG
jgi:hypothetical protein